MNDAELDLALFDRAQEDAALYAPQVNAPLGFFLRSAMRHVGCDLPSAGPLPRPSASLSLSSADHTRRSGAL